MDSLDYFIKKLKRDEDRIFYLGLSLCLISFVVVVTIFLPPPPEKDISGITKDEALNEACVLEKSMKYPTSSDAVINRLCYLEEVERKLVAAE